MEIFFKRTKKIALLIIIFLAITMWTSKILAATVYTNNINKGDKLKFTGNSWCIYNTEAKAKNLNGASSYLKKGDQITVEAKNGNVLKIGSNKYIYYGSTGDKNFTKVSSGGSANKSKTINVTSINLNVTSATLNVNETKQLTVTFNPGNATNKNITWSSNNTSIVTVSNGKITAKKAGTATITAKSSNGKTATCKITVKATKYKYSKTFRFTWYSKSECGSSVTGSGKNEKNFKIDKNLGCYTYNGKVVLAGATNELAKSWRVNKKDYIKYFSYNNEVEFTYKGKTYTGIILDSCGVSMNPYNYYKDYTNVLDMFFPTNQAANKSGINQQKLTVYYN